MYKLFFIPYFLLLYLEAKEIQPIATLQVSGLVSDFIVDKKKLYVATDEGVVDIIDLVSQKIVRQIHFKPLQTAMGETIPVRIHSIDRHNGKTLMVTSSISAYRNVWIDDGKKLTKVIDESKHLMPKRAYFANDGKIILGTFGSDIVLYDTNEGFKLYERHISESTMGGMVLSNDKKKMLIADESGTARLIDINSSKIEQTFDSEHVDNIYSVAYAQGTIITGGQDKRVGIYTKDDAFHIKSNFLVYCVGLSPSGEIGVYSSGLAHDLQLFMPENGQKTDKLVGHQATPTKILFVSENTLVSAGDEYTIYFWVLNQKPITSLIK